VWKRGPNQSKRIGPLPWSAAANCADITTKRVSMGTTIVRCAGPEDCEQLSRLRETLWPESPASDHAQELAPFLAGERSGTMPSTIFVAESSEGVLTGFLEVGLRSHADGCDPRRPVGSVEGLFVSEAYRRAGIGARLLEAAEAWARLHGCVEMAADTWLEATLSQRVHEALKFDVVDRCVHYRRRL